MPRGTRGTTAAGARLRTEQRRREHVALSKLSPPSDQPHKSGATYGVRTSWPGNGVRQTLSTTVTDGSADVSVAIVTPSGMASVELVTEERLEALEARIAKLEDRDGD